MKTALILASAFMALAAGFGFADGLFASAIINAGIAGLLGYTGYEKTRDWWRVRKNSTAQDYPGAE